MELSLHKNSASASDAIDRLAAEMGIWRLAAAVALRLVSRPARPLPPRHLPALPDHLRRDIGLADLPAPPGLALPLGRDGLG